MLRDKHLRVNSSAGTSGWLPFPASGKAGVWWLGAGLVYAGLGFPGGTKVVREISAIINRPKYIAEMAAMGAGALLILNSSSA